MTPRSYPQRVRLHGGRNVHAARVIPTSSSGRVTSCDRYIDAGSVNDWRPDSTPITCPACLRAIEKEQQR